MTIDKMRNTLEEIREQCVESISAFVKSFYGEVNCVEVESSPAITTHIDRDYYLTIDSVYIEKDKTLNVSMSGEYENSDCEIHRLDTDTLVELADYLYTHEEELRRANYVG